MKRFKNFSKRTSALLIAAVLLLVAGTVTGTRAAFIAQSNLYKAQFYTNHLEVHLLENGKDVCGGANTAKGATKVTGALATSLGYSNTSDGETLGSVDPGKAYDEMIQAKNGKDVDQYVRLTVRKYWLNADGSKAIDLSPSLIKLTYNGQDYNNSNWVLGESSTESATYYYRTPLGANATSEPLFDKLTIDKSVAPDMHMPTDEELKSDAYKDYVTVTTDETTGKTIYSFSYMYDGYTFYIEADVQALQTHSAQDAIHSTWGVYNVIVNTSDGSLSVQ